MFTILIGGAIVFGLIAVINPLTGKIILATIAGSTGAFGNWLRKQFPEWIMQHELDKAGREVNKYWEAIEENKSHNKGLERKISDKQREVVRLGKLAEQAAKQNTPQGDAEAKDFLRDKRRIQEELNIDETTISDKNQEIQSTLAKIQDYERNVEQTKQWAQANAVRLQTKRIDAALSKKLHGLNDLNNSGLAQAKEAMNQAMDRAEAGTEINKERYRREEIEHKYTVESTETELEADLAALKTQIASHKPVN